MRRPRPEAAARAAQADERTVRTAALALLAGRDFTRHELAQRLGRRGYQAALIEAVIVGLVAENLLREERFVEQFVGQHSRRGRGPMRIRQDLRQRGIGSAAIDSALQAGDVDWAESARAARRRRFGTALPADQRERAKQARFLQYRGFSSDQIRAALGPGEDDQDPD